MQPKNVLSGILAAALMFALAATTAPAKEISKISAVFENTGSESNATGAVKSAMRSTSAKFDCRLAGLVPGRTYQLRVGDLPEATFTAGSTGKVKLKFQAKAGKPSNLDFDPRGQQIAVHNGTTDVLTVLFSGTGEPASTIVTEETLLIPTVLAPGGQGGAKFVAKSGVKTFAVNVANTPPGDYELLVAGGLAGSLAVGSAGSGSLQFSSAPDPGESLLDFEPRGQGLDIVQGTNVFYTGVLRARIQGVSVCATGAVQVLLTSTGLDADAEAAATATVHENCVREFAVAAEALPSGDYDLFVAGVNRGLLRIEPDGTETNGRIEFSTDPGAQGKQLLTFDLAGQAIEIRQGTNIFFAAPFINGTPAPAPDCQYVATEVTLFNTGFDSAGKGVARFFQQENCRQYFRVEVTDLPLGAFKAHVGGVERGTITVVDIGGGQHAGAIEFDTDPDPNDVDLDFDPRGQLIEVEKNGDIYLSRTLPN